MQPMQNIGISFSRKAKEYWDDDGTNLKPNVNRTVRDYAGNLLGGFDDNGVIDSPVIKAADTIGSTILTNGTFETWAEGSPSNWSVIDVSGTTGAISQEGTIKHAGSYSVKLVTSAGGDAKAGEQIKTGLTSGNYYQVSGYGYVGAGENCSLVVLDDSLATATKCFNFVTSVWDDIASLGSDHNLILNSGSAAWTTASAIVTVPASTKLNVLFAAGGSSTTAYVDDVALKLYTYAANKDLFEFSNTSDATNLTASDTVINFVTTGGTDKVHLTLNGAGAYSTDYTTFNFATKGINTKKSTSAVSGSTPSAAEIVTAFGTAASVGSGFVGILSPSDTKTFICTSDGTNWYFSAAQTKAT